MKKIDIVVEYVRNNPGCFPAEIAEQTGVKKQTVVTSLQRMVIKGKAINRGGYRINDI